MLINAKNDIFTVAIVENDTVVNTIKIDADNMSAFSNFMELIETEPYGLRIGDYRESENWYRDIDGVKTALPITDPEEDVADMQEALSILGVSPQEG